MRWDIRSFEPYEGEFTLEDMSINDVINWLEENRAYYGELGIQILPADNPSYTPEQWRAVVTKKSK